MQEKNYLHNCTYCARVTCIDEWGRQRKLACMTEFRAATKSRGLVDRPSIPAFWRVSVDWITYWIQGHPWQLLTPCTPCLQHNKVKLTVFLAFLVKRLGVMAQMLSYCSCRGPRLNSQYHGGSQPCITKSQGLECPPLTSSTSQAHTYIYKYIHPGRQNTHMHKAK